MSRVYNFSAGPAVLPVEVLQEAADEMLVFSQLVLKFYLADTPHLQNAKHFGGWL